MSDHVALARNDRLTRLHEMHRPFNGRCAMDREGWPCQTAWLLHEIDEHADLLAVIREAIPTPEARV